MKEKLSLTLSVVTVLAVVAVASYYATTVHNFRPVNKVLDPDIIVIHDAWATRTAPGQPTLPPDVYAESVTLSVWSDNSTYLRALETWLNHNGHPVRKSAYRDDLRHDTELQYLEFYVHENELFPISEQLAKWPTVYRVDLTTDYGPGAPLNSPASCAHRFVNALRQNPNIKSPDDIPLASSTASTPIITSHATPEWAGTPPYNQPSTIVSSTIPFSTSIAANSITGSRIL